MDAADLDRTIRDELETIRSEIQDARDTHEYGLVVAALRNAADAIEIIAAYLIERDSAGDLVRAAPRSTPRV